MSAVLLSLLVAAAPAAPQTNLLLVTVDTLRADRVGAYGYAPAQTPAIDRLAREGVLLEDAVVQVPQTRPSHASILTGLLPYEHGLRDNSSPPLEKRFVTLAERLQSMGYATGGFVGAYPVSADSGLDQGFEHFDDPFAVLGKRRGSEERSERRAAEVVGAALGWLEHEKQRPFFAWIHLFDPHAPYEPPPPYRERFPKSPYDGEIAYADSQLARLLGWLDGSGLADHTLVVVTSDHGEGLGDHGEDEHLLFLYDTTLKVPLLLRWPGRLPAGRRVSGQFRSVDLVPTLVDLLGGGTPEGTSGASRAADLRQGRELPDNESYAESLYGQLHHGWAPLHALRGEGWKFIDAPRPELYRLTEDPGERRNRFDERGSVAEAMRRRLHTAYAAQAPPPSEAVLDAAAAERLAALGYVGGAFFSGAPSGADPKDKIGEFQEYRHETTAAIELFGKRDYAGAERILRRLSRPVPTPDGQLRERKSFNVSFYLGRSLLEQGRAREAIGPLAEAAALSPSSVPAQLQLARAHAAAGEIETGLAAAERGLKLAPASAPLLQLQGRLLLLRGDTAGGRRALEKARDADPADAATRVALADLYRGLGEAERARAEAEAAVRAAPAWAGAHVAYGLALGAVGQEARAAEELREALRREPDQPDALFFLAAVERRAGRPAAAVPLLERLVARTPGYPGAGDALAGARAEAAPPAQGTVSLRLLRVTDAERAEALLARLRAGADFAALAREASADASASNGGLLGDVSLADLALPLRRAAAALAPGETSPVVRTESGYVILRRDH